MLKKFGAKWVFSVVLMAALAWTGMALAQGQSDMAVGELRKLDVVAGKVTIRHGEIRSIDMPPMTMVFVMKNPQALAGFKVGDKVEFAAIEEAGKFVVTELKHAP